MKLWGGRFQKSTSRQVEEFSASLPFDKRLYRQDIAGSIAYSKALALCGVISDEEADKIQAGLGKIQRDIESGQFVFDVGDEDIHMAIERALIAAVGPAGGKLHTARSRNDQIAVDLRLFLKSAIVESAASLVAYEEALLLLAKEHRTAIMPGYTHMQRAQPVLFSHHALAYVFMALRDFRRLVDCYREADALPLGSGALAGTSFDIDREYLAKELGFSAGTDNSMDAVSDRDFVIQFLATAALIMAHLSRLAEEVILWTGSEFNFLVLDDAYATGSSMMPQKKNPDVAELVRGKCGRVFGHLQAMLTVLKGLPLTYNRDLQEDKELLFDTVDTVTSCLSVFAGMLKTARVNEPAMEAAAAQGFSTATDYADYLVKQGVPFRSAHEIVGRMVGELAAAGRQLDSLTLEELRSYNGKFDEGALSLGDVRRSVESRAGKGGTSSGSVEKQLRKAEEILEQERAWIEERSPSGPA